MPAGSVPTAACAASWVREGLPQPSPQGDMRGCGVRLASIGVCVHGGCAGLPPSSGIHWQVATAALANLRWDLPCNCFNLLMGNNRTVIN